METPRKILIITSSLDNSHLPLQTLTRAGFQLFEAATNPDVLVQFKVHDFDLIITGPPEDGTSDFFLLQGYPEDVPILCIGLEADNNTRFSGLVSCLATIPGNLELCGQAEILAQARNLYRQNAEKDLELAKLSEKLRQQQQSMKQHNEFLDVLASRDGLTGLFNRRQMNKVLWKEFENCSEHGADLSLLIIDIDYFNELNKTAGRSYGDFVLNDFAARLTAHTSPTGICFRFSGEIFVSLLPATGFTEAVNIAETIRHNLMKKPFVRGAEERFITISVGVVSFFEHRPDDPDEFITMAERALFTAKAEGRNRVVVNRPIAVSPGNTSEQNLVFLKETLTKILDKTRTSAIASLQLLAKDLAGEKNQNHIKNVRTYAELLGEYINLPKPIIQTFKNAITLHTSIRFLLHNKMINKRERFSVSDREMMNDFPYKLAEITELFDYFSNERAILLYHGERYDGTGYPDGLKGYEIPLGARIFSLVDALAAMNADRPYRPRLKPKEIIAELTEGAGSQFDPYLVTKSLELIKTHRLLEIDAAIIDQSIATIINSFPDCSL